MKKNELQTEIQRKVDDLNGTNISYFDRIDKSLLNFFLKYKKNEKPIEVNFRELVNWVPYSESYTHYMHSYPAKLIKHIPIYFLNSKLLLPKSKSLVLDPFCGSGTVLLESLIAGHNSIGCDSNPLARLIAKVKTTKIDVSLIEAKKDEIIRNAKRYRKIHVMNVVNVEHWFSSRTISELSKIKRSISERCCADEYDFFMSSFSNIIKKVSFADPNLSVPVKINPEKYNDQSVRLKITSRINELENIDVYKIFSEQVTKNAQRIAELEKINTEGLNCSVVSSDARRITKNIESDDAIDSGSVDIILTSPPYAGAQKYIRSSSLSLGWLGYCENNTLRDYERLNIGREHYNKHEYKDVLSFNIPEIDGIISSIENISPLRAHINANYLNEMECSIREMYRVLKKDKYCIIVIGNNEVCGMKFETQKYIRQLAERIGFTTELVLVDDIHSRGLMTKRNKTASIINSEWILVFKK